MNSSNIQDFKLKSRLFIAVVSKGQGLIFLQFLKRCYLTYF